MKTSLYIFVLIILSCNARKEKPPIVLQTDFGLKDGAVAAMKGVIQFC